MIFAWFSEEQEHYLQRNEKRKNLLTFMDVCEKNNEDF